MEEHKNSDMVAPPAEKGENFYRTILKIGVGGIVSGGLILLFYVAFLIPAFEYNWRVMGVVAVFLALFGFTVNYFFSIRHTRRLIEWTRKDARGEAIDTELWNDARECAIRLPRLSATASLILWVTAPIILSIAMVMLGRFGWYQALYVAISGFLVGPLNALMYFYALREVIHRCLKRMYQYDGIRPRDVSVPLVPLRFKLIFSFTCLVVCPMLFAVILDRHQQDKYVTSHREAKVVETIDMAANAYRENGSWRAVERLITEKNIPRSYFFAVNETADLLFGQPPEKMKNEALARIASGGLDNNYLQFSDRYFAARELPEDGVWIVGVYHRVDDTRGFWRRNGLIIFLLLVLGGIGIYLGRDASMDTMRPVKEMMEISRMADGGDFTGRGVYLSDDELGLLGEVFTKFVGNIRNQLEISDQMISDIRATIDSLGKHSDDVNEVVSQQRMGVGDQMMGLNQAQSVSGQITEAARDIQEKAASIKDMASRTTSDCMSGRELLNSASEGMRLIGGSMEEISNQMEGLMKHYQSILDVVKLIQEINERTDMLSMNASLEAAGAKRQGKRFGVVAQEVRRLADKTAQSTSKIQLLFDSIRISSDKCMDTLHDGDERVRNGLSLMERLIDNFGCISENARATSEAVAQIHVMTTQQTTACLQMQETITDVAEAGKIVEDGANATEETVRSLSEISSNLKVLVEADKIDEG